MADVMSIKDCKHPHFRGQIAVQRFENTGGFLAEIRINCTDCGAPFEFQGLGTGLDLHGATVDVTGQELRVCITPPGEKLSPLDRMGCTIGPGKLSS